MSNVDSINVDASIAGVLNAANPASAVDQVVGGDPLTNGGGRTELTVAPPVDKPPDRSSISTTAAISLNGTQSCSALTIKSSPMPTGGRDTTQAAPKKCSRHAPRRISR